MKIIGISGYAGAGKDEAALALKQIGYERRAFADPLREFLYVMNPIIETGTHYNLKLQQIVDMFGWAKLKEHPYKNNYRNLIQTVGTDCVRNILGEDTWAKASMNKLDADGSYVFSDCRFPNEADAIKSHGGYIVRINRPGVTPALNHTSETSLDDYVFDYEIVNDGTVEELREKAIEIGKECRDNLFF